MLDNEDTVYVSEPRFFSDKEPVPHPHGEHATLTQLDVLQA
jgi:hypothetical protein